MSRDHVAAYLNDHLAGSVAALELLEHLETAHAGTDLGRFVTSLRTEIVADQQKLAALLTRLDISASVPRKMAAWLAEKVTELKLKWDDEEKGPLRLLEALEAVSIGIEGKQALWRSLAAASRSNPHLRGPDYDQLERRAEEQRRQVEPLRVEAAEKALGASW